MQKLPQILKDLEQGKISADWAEDAILDLFNVSSNASHKEQEEKECQQFLKEAKEYWNKGEKINAVKYVRYAYNYLSLQDGLRYCEKHFNKTNP